MGHSLCSHQEQDEHPSIQNQDAEQVFAPCPPILIHWPNWGISGRKHTLCGAGFGAMECEPPRHLQMMKKAPRKMKMKQGGIWSPPGELQLCVSQPPLVVFTLELTKAWLSPGCQQELGLKIAACEGEGILNLEQFIGRFFSRGVRTCFTNPL